MKINNNENEIDKAFVKFWHLKIHRHDLKDMSNDHFLHLCFTGRYTLHTKKSTKASPKFHFQPNIGLKKKQYFYWLSVKYQKQKFFLPVHFDLELMSFLENCIHEEALAQPNKHHVQYKLPVLMRKSRACTALATS